MRELTGQDVFDSECLGSEGKGGKQLCFIVFLPNLMDSKASGRNVYLKVRRIVRKPACHVSGILVVISSLYGLDCQGVGPPCIHQGVRPVRSRMRRRCGTTWQRTGEAHNGRGFLQVKWLLGFSKGRGCWVSARDAAPASSRSIAMARSWPLGTHRACDMRFSLGHHPLSTNDCAHTCGHRTRRGSPMLVGSVPCKLRWKI